MKVFIHTYTPLRDRDAEHSKQKLLANKLLEYALKECYRLNLAEQKIGKSPKGKPYFENIDVKFSKSHTDGMVAVAVSDKEVGVDCQTIKNVSPKLVSRVCNDTEKKFVEASADIDKAFALVWAKKEALVKLSGEGLSVSLKDIDTSKVTSFLSTDSYAIAAVDEIGSKAEFIFVSEEEIGA